MWGWGLSPSSKRNSDLQPRLALSNLRLIERSLGQSKRRSASPCLGVGRLQGAALVAVRKGYAYLFTDGHKGRTLQPDTNARNLNSCYLFPANSFDV